MTHTTTRSTTLSFALRGPWRMVLGLLLGLLLSTSHAVAGSILFIGNSFTYAAGSPVHFYRADTVTDLNSQGIGGVRGDARLQHAGPEKTR